LTWAATSSRAASVVGITISLECGTSGKACKAAPGVLFFCVEGGPSPTVMTGQREGVRAAAPGPGPSC
jgi:hypothetical protein